MMAWLLVLALTVMQPTTITYYHPSLEGNVMANGEVYNPDDSTIAASNDYPLGSLLVVCPTMHVEAARNDERQETDHLCIIVIVKDRMRVDIHDWVDLSERAFTRLSPLSRGRLEGLVWRIKREK